MRRACVVCGTEFMPSPHGRPNRLRKTCSAKCWASLRLSTMGLAHGNSEKSCAVCGTGFVPSPPNYKRRTCSAACREILKVSTWKLLRIYNSKRCARCGKEFRYSDAKATFCSKRCGSKFYYENNKDTRVAQIAEWRTSNPEKVKRIHKQHLENKFIAVEVVRDLSGARKTPKLSAKELRRNREYARKNREKILAYHAMRWRTDEEYRRKSRDRGLKRRREEQLALKTIKALLNQETSNA